MTAINKTSIHAIQSHRENTDFAVQNKKTSLGKISSIKKYAGIVAKIIDLWLDSKLMNDKESRKIVSKKLQIQVKELSKLTASDEKTLAIDSKISHLKRDISGIFTKKILGDKLQVESRNMLSSDLFTRNKKSLVGENGSLSKVVSQDDVLKFVGTKSAKKFSKQLTNVQATVKKGVCSGLCIDFASKLLNETSISPTNIVSIAQNYQSGAPAEAAANQIAYKLFNENNKMEDYIKNAGSNFDDAKKMGVIDDGQYEMLKTILDITANMNSGKGEILSRLSDRVNQSSKEDKPFNSFVFSLALLRFDGNLNSETAKAVRQVALDNVKDGGQLSSLEALMNLFETAILKIPTLPTKKIESNSKSQSAQKTKVASQSLKQNNITSTPNQLRPLSELYSISISKQAAHVANLRGLNLSEDLLDNVDRRQNDSRILDNIYGFKDGVYSMEFGTGDGGHATLILKSNDEFHFWDPNFGLIKCDKENPKSTILMVLKEFYKEPSTKLDGQEDGANHQITIKQFSKKE